MLVELPLLLLLLLLLATRPLIMNGQLPVPRDIAMDWEVGGEGKEAIAIGIPFRRQGIKIEIIKDLIVNVSFSIPGNAKLRNFVPLAGCFVPSLVLLVGSVATGEW